MFRKAFIFFKTIILSMLFLCFANCKTQNTEGGNASPSSVSVDISLIPKDTILSIDKNLKLDNGIFYLNNKPYSGFIKAFYPNNALQSVGSYLNGMQHGITQTFFPDGKTRDIRSYKANKSFGRHYGFWENGNMKFDFIYYDDKRDGYTKQWYESGKPYAFLNFKDDKEDGMQQAWRENGKIYINYEAKDGFRYGLQKAALCYTLIDEKLNSPTPRGGF